MPDNLEQLATALVGAPIAGAVAIGGGRNSRVYRVIDARGRRYALKVYFRHPQDPRDRLGTEFASLQFLRAHGVRDVPEPLGAAWDAGCALYEYVEGEPIGPGAAAERDVDLAIEFLGRLKELSACVGAARFPPASEACFSFPAIGASLRARLDRLRHVQDGELVGFLTGELVPAVEMLLAWSRDRLAGGGGPVEQELPPEERTLSPSDFGFHNALRRGGRIVFLDFEYFGWDDPAKTIADFVLHPAMRLPEALRRRFVASLLQRFGEQQGLPARVAAVYPLFGLKWCLILLNEFLGADYERRQFAGLDKSDRRAVQRRQLAKARGMLERIKGEYEQFPWAA